MGVVQPNYFTCTLGEAARWKAQAVEPTQESYETIIELIDGQARRRPQSPALGFADFKSEDKRPKCAMCLGSCNLVS